MGICLGLVFDKALPEADAFSKFTDGKDLASAMDRLDEIAQAKGVTPFSTFAPDFESLAEEGETLDDTYFRCTDGLRTIAALIHALRAEKEWSKGMRKNEVKVVMECLQELERCLQVGKKKKARFYLLYY